MGIKELAAEVKGAQVFLGAINLEIRNKALGNILVEIKNRKDEIIEANLADMTKAREEQVSAPLLKRLKFDEIKVNEVCGGIESLINLPDPGVWVSGLRTNR